MSSENVAGCNFLHKMKKEIQRHGLQFFDPDLVELENRSIAAIK
jgi:hypothetical protein